MNSYHILVFSNLLEKISSSFINLYVLKEMGQSKSQIQFSRRMNMENTNEFIKKLQEKQKKDEQNRKRQGNHDPSSKLPTNRDKG